MSMVPNEAVVVVDRWVRLTAFSDGFDFSCFGGISHLEFGGNASNFSLLRGTHESNNVFVANYHFNSFPCN